MWKKLKHTLQHSLFFTPSYAAVVLATLEKTVKCFHPCRLHLIDRRARWLGGCLNNLLNLLRNTLSGYYCDHCSRYIVMNSLHRHGQYREHGSGVIKHFLCCWFVFCPNENANISRLNPNKLQFHNSVLSSSLPKKNKNNNIILFMFNLSVCRRKKNSKQM